MARHAQGTSQIAALLARLTALKGVRAAVASESEIIVEANGRKVCRWAPDGPQLRGAFACEAAVLCADTVDEAYRLTVARI